MTIPQKYHGPIYFRIKVKECLEDKWSDWFEPMTVSSDGRETILTDSVADQAALYGLLIRIRDLNLTLLAVKRIERDQESNRYVP